MCISPGALLSALILRVEREDYRPTDDDLRGLLGSGCSREQIDRALERGGAPCAEARARLAALGRGCGGGEDG